MDSLSTAVGLLVDLLQVGVGVVGAVLLTKTRPPARAPGVAGCLLLAASGLVAATSRLTLPSLVEHEVPYWLVSLLVSLGYGLPAVAGVGLLVRALLLATRPAPAYPSYPQASYPQPSYPQPPYPQPPYPQRGSGPADQG